MLYIKIKPTVAIDSHNQETYSKMATVFLPDPNGENRLLAVSWGVGNTLALAPSTKSQNPPDGLRGDVCVHEVRWETTLFQPIFRDVFH